MKKFAFVSAMALVAATPAFAQSDDGASREPSAFNGASIAVFAGVDVLTIQENNAADTARDLLYGGSIGYDHDAGGVVIGAQVEVTKSQASYQIDDLLVTGDHFASEAGRDIYGGVRVGITPSPTTLLYVGGGYVSSQLTSTYTSGATNLTETEDRGGFRVSLGLEVQRKRVFGRLEMRYQDLGDYTVFSQPTGFARTNTQIVAGLGVRF